MKRYDQMHIDGYNGAYFTQIKPMVGGDYVLYSDVEALEKENELLRNNTAMRINGQDRIDELEKQLVEKDEDLRIFRIIEQDLKADIAEKEKESDALKCRLKQIYASSYSDSSIRDDKLEALEQKVRALEAMLAMKQDDWIKACNEIDEAHATGRREGMEKCHNIVLMLSENKMYDPPTAKAALNDAEFAIRKAAQQS